MIAEVSVFMPNTFYYIFHLVCYHADESVVGGALISANSCFLSLVMTSMALLPFLA